MKNTQRECVEAVDGNGLKRIDAGIWFKQWVSMLDPILLAHPPPQHRHTHRHILADVREPVVGLETIILGQAATIDQESSAMSSLRSAIVVQACTKSNGLLSCESSPDLAPDNTSSDIANREKPVRK